MAIGNPRGLEGSLSEGIISGVRLERDFSLIQITAPISPGSSGGPVLDEDGHVVGVATMTLTESQNLNFAVPATLISTLRTKGERLEPVVVGNGVKIDHGSAGIRLIEPVFEDIYGGFDYSLKNENDRPIENLHYILLFRSSSGEVLHFQIVELKKPIPPGLAIRRRHANMADERVLEEMSGYMLEGQATGSYHVGDGYLKGLCTVELRTLSFDFVNSSPEDDLLRSLNK